MLKSFQLENFKAVRNSKAIKFTPLTVFIGNNGSGKSSIIEGLYTYQSIIRDGLDDAMNYWRGFEHILNLAVSHLIVEEIRDVVETGKTQVILTTHSPYLLDQTLKFLVLPLTINLTCCTNVVTWLLCY